jgi:chromosome segregation ATPase
MDEETKIKKEIFVLRERRTKENKALDDVLAAINNTRLELQDYERQVKFNKDLADRTQKTVDEYIARRKEYELILDTQNEKSKENSTEISKLEVEKEKLATDVAGLVVTYTEKEKIEQARIAKIAKDNAKEESKLQASVIALNDEIEVLRGQIEASEKILQENKQAKQVIAEDIKRLSDEITTKESLTTKLDEDIAGKEAQIANLEKTEADLKAANGLLIKSQGDLNDVSTALKGEIKELEAKKATADAEYEAAAPRLFAIAEKEAELKQKEEYIKEKFKEAGVNY